MKPMMEAEIVHPDRISNIFDELESRNILLTTCTGLYKSITNKFESLQRTLDQKKRELDSRIELFDSQTEETLKYYEERKSSISEREASAVVRVEELRKSVTSEFENNDVENGASSEDLRSFCKKMDAKGLMKLLVSKRKEPTPMKSEITLAIEDSVDAHRLALDSIEAFVNAKYAKGGGAADKRWASGMLLEAVFPVAELESGKKLVASSIRARAVELAEKWRGWMGGEGGEVGVAAGEAGLFLHMVCGYGIRDRFNEDFFRKLVVEHAERRDMAKIGIILGLREKMEGIIEELINRGKEIEAIYFAFESGSTDRFPPIDLLKSYVRNSKRNVNSILKKGNSSAAAMEEAGALELSSCKAIIKCVEDIKLEEKFPIESLKKRVSQLEKAKAEKKKTGASASKHSSKRGRGGAGRDAGHTAFRPSKTGRYGASSSFPQRNVPQQQTSSSRYPAQYNFQSQGVYEGMGSVSYGSGYGATHTQVPVTIAHKYQYPSQDSAAAGVRALGSYGVQAYGAYEYGSAATSAGIPSQTYPTLYPQ